MGIVKIDTVSVNPPVFHHLLIGETFRYGAAGWICLKVSPTTGFDFHTKNCVRFDLTESVVPVNSKLVVEE